MISAGAKHLITMCLALVVVSAACELDGGIFLQGDLISPKGRTTDTNVFIVFDEWKCGSWPIRQRR